jgi:signal transduction histidine kinase
LKNGLRALESIGGGEITITLKTGEKFNEIIVADNGPGIAPEIVSHIFVPFFTGERQGQGTGIGLAFSRFVVESFNGTLSCRSQLGAGATFIISLPVVNPNTSTQDLHKNFQRR